MEIQEQCLVTIHNDDECKMRFYHKNYLIQSLQKIESTNSEVLIESLLAHQGKYIQITDYKVKIYHSLGQFHKHNQSKNRHLE